MMQRCERYVIDQRSMGEQVEALDSHSNVFYASPKGTQVTAIQYVLFDEVGAEELGFPYGFFQPLMVLMREVLPEPDGPMMERTSPFLIEKSIPFRTS